MEPENRLVVRGLESEWEALLRDLAGAEAEFQRAIALDPTLASGYLALANTQISYDWDWDATEHELNQAIALAPSYSCAHEDRAEYFAFQGRRSEAEAEVAKSLELDTSVNAALTESAVDYQLRDFDPLTRDLADAFSGPRPAILSDVSAAAWRTSGDTVERIELLALGLVSGAQSPESVK